MLIHPRQPPENARRRSCRDRWKYQRHQHRRRRATADPATSVFLQLLALVLVVFGRAPVVPSVPAAASAARPYPASRLRDDRSPEARERERGEGGYPMPPRWDRRRYGRYKSTPTYRRLVRDIQRPAARKEALDILRRRLDLPPEAAGWLDKLDGDGDLAALLLYVRPGLTDTASEAELLLAAVEWLESQRDPERSSSLPAPPDDGDGQSGKGRGHKPPPDDDNDGLPPPGGTKGPP